MTGRNYELFWCKQTFVRKSANRKLNRNSITEIRQINNHFVRLFPKNKATILKDPYQNRIFISSIN